MRRTHESIFAVCGQPDRLDTAMEVAELMQQYSWVIPRTPAAVSAEAPTPLTKDGPSCGGHARQGCLDWVATKLSCTARCMGQPQTCKVLICMITIFLFYALKQAYGIVFSYGHKPLSLTMHSSRHTSQSLEYTLFLPGQTRCLCRCSAGCG